MTPQPSTVAIASQREHLVPTDDVLTICPISIVAGILTNILHEGVGHGLTALLTGEKSGVLTTVAWSSVFESLLVEAGRNFGESRGWAIVLGRSAQRHTRIHAHALLPAHHLCIQLVHRNRVLFLFRSKRISETGRL